MKLTKKEEEIMQVVWKLKAAFIREITESLSEPRPHYNSVATIVKILVKKGFLKSELMGNSHRYSPVIDFETYRSEDLKQIKKKYFSGSLPKMMAYFAKSESLSEQEVEELIALIKSSKD